MIFSQHTLAPQRSSRQGFSVQGFSIAEAAIVLGIVALILIAIWGLTSVILERVKVTTTVDRVTTTVQNMHDIWRGRGVLTGNFATLTDILIRQSIIPADMVTDRAAITLTATNAWGGVYSINDNRPGTDALADGAAVAGGVTFRVRMTGLSRGGCVALATRIGGATSSIRPLSTVVGGTVVNDVTVPNVTGNCEAVNGNTVDFIYRLRAPGA